MDLIIAQQLIIKLQIQKKMRKQKKKVSFAQYQQYQTQFPKEIKLSWSNINGKTCKLITGPNRCFCKHSFEQHKEEKSSIKCDVEKCTCDKYEYVPYFDIKCLCRHSYKDHDKGSRKCKMCNKCLGFMTNWSCKCGYRFDQHYIIKEGKSKNDKLLKKSIKQFKQTKQNFDSLDKLYAQHYDKETPSIKERYTHTDRSKQEILKRVNRKYGEVNNTGSDYPLWVENAVMSGKQNWKKEKNGLDLFMKPHNYRYVSMEKMLE